MDGQKNKSDNMKHLHWKIIATKQHLKNDANIRRPGTSQKKKKKKENEVQIGNALIFVNRSTRIVNCTKNMLKVPAKELVQSILHTKQDIIVYNKKVSRSTTTRFAIELDGDIILQQVRLHPRAGSSTTIGSRIKVGIIVDLQPGLNSKIVYVQKPFSNIRTGEPVAKVISTLT